MLYVLGRRLCYRVDYRCLFTFLKLYLFILFSIHLFLVWFCFMNPYLNAFTMLEISLIKQSLAQLYKT